MYATERTSQLKARIIACAYSKGSTMEVPLVSSLPLGSVGSIGPLLDRAPAAEIAPALALLPPSLTTVDLSPLGRFLSAAALFQKKMLELQVSGTTVTESQAQELSEILASSSTLVVAFNQLQTASIDSADVDAGSLDQQSLPTLFAQQFAARTEADGGDADTALASLASIGLSFTGGPDAGDSLRADLPLLQVALEVDPATTTGLLRRAGEAFGALVQADPGVQDAPALAQAAPVTAPANASLPSSDDLLLQEIINERVAAGAPPFIPVDDQEAQLEDMALAANQAGAATANRTLAEQTLGDRAATLESNEGSQEDRFAMSQLIEEQDRLKQASIDVQARMDEQQRQQAIRSAQQLAMDGTLEPMATASATPSLPRTGQTVAQEAPMRSPAPTAGLRDQALQAARDPAIAAAIAAYSLNTGAFAALNARQELAAQRPKAVPAVSGVSKVSGVASATEPKPGNP